ncbi:hypothetical protein [Maribacter sp. HTCC2170]|uniref:hypothetical protein n=1 Tax=Maribacter sp. (strain HTCC2170 / KCCM 42371) TaxID=313603 RepID=UPI00006AFCF9|nr:hypothetical protein [Maribacter sp. HTCC2170]EAR01466.1 hypothetical protein FB2170_12116 [Maribacter sp. HTCC2170]
MTNKTIQDRLSFFALAGTRDRIHENRMFTNRRRKQKSSALLDAQRVEKDLNVRPSVQLSLF